MPFGLKNAPSIFQRKMDNCFIKYSKFTCVYIDDILVFSKNKQEHIGHLKLVLKEFMDSGIIISSKKAQFFRNNIEFLGTEIGNGKIKLQPHISQKALEYKVETIKDLQRFLGLVNYARPFIKNLGKITGPLYSKIGINGIKSFNSQDYKQIEKIKEAIIEIPEMRLPLDSDYLIIETDGCELGWGAVLKRKPNKYSSKKEEELCRYSSGKYKEKGILNSLDQEILAVGYGLDSFRLFLISKKEILVRIDCEAIVKFHNNQHSKRINQRRWLTFRDKIVNNNYNVIFEHIKGKDNSLADQLSRITLIEFLQEPP